MTDHDTGVDHNHVPSSDDKPSTEGDGTVLARLNDPPEKSDEAPSDQQPNERPGDGTTLARLNDSSR